MTLAHGLYEEAEDTQAAIKMPREIVAAGRRLRSTASRSNRREETQQASPATTATSTNYSSAEKNAHNVGMRLKDRDKKFSGDLSDSWMEYVDDCLQLCRDHSLSPSQKLQYQHNLLQGDAKKTVPG